MNSIPVTSLHNIDCECHQYSDSTSLSDLRSFFKNGVGNDPGCANYIASKIISLLSDEEKERKACCEYNLIRVVESHKDGAYLVYIDHMREVIDKHPCCFATIYDFISHFNYSVDREKSKISYLSVYRKRKPENEYGPVVDLTHTCLPKKKEYKMYRNPDDVVRVVTEKMDMSVGELLSILCLHQMNNNDQNTLDSKGPKKLYREANNPNRVRSSVVKKIRKLVDGKRGIMTASDLEPVWDLISENHDKPTQILRAKYVIRAFSTVDESRDVTYSRWEYDGREEATYTKYHCISTRSVKVIHYISNGRITLPICDHFLEELMPILHAHAINVLDKETK